MRALVGDRRLDVGARTAALLDAARERVEPPHAVQLVGAADLRGVERAAQHARSTRRRSCSGTGNGWPSLPPCANEKRAGSSKRVGVPCTTSATSASDCSVRGPSCSSSSNEAKSRSSRSWRQRQHRAEPPLVDVAGAHVVVRRHLQPADARPACAPGSSRRSPAAPRCAGGARRSTRFRIVPAASPTMAVCGSAVKSRHRRRVPVIAAGQAARLVHALLHDRPLAVGGHHERVQVDLEAVGDGVVVDARGQAAGADQRVAVEAGATGDVAQLVAACGANAGRGRRRCRCPARARAGSGPSSARPSPTS